MKRRNLGLSAEEEKEALTLEIGEQHTKRDAEMQMNTLN